MRLRRETMCLQRETVSLRRETVHLRGECVLQKKVKECLGWEIRLLRKGTEGLE